MPAKVLQRVRFGGIKFFPHAGHGPTIIPDDLLAAYPGAAKQEEKAGRIKMIASPVPKEETKATEAQQQAQDVLPDIGQMDWKDARDYVMNVVDGQALERLEIYERARIGSDNKTNPRPSVIKALEAQKRLYASLQ